MLSGFKYKDQVLGKDVAVKFRVARSAAAAKNYLGSIRRMQVHLDDDGEIEILHQVRTAYRARSCSQLVGGSGVSAEVYSIVMDGILQQGMYFILLLDEIRFRI